MSIISPSVKTTFENINIGETVRLFLEIDDLLDGSNNPIHLDSITKVTVERLNNNHLNINKPNSIISSFFGPRNIFIAFDNIPVNSNFRNFQKLDLSFVDLSIGSFFVKITSPSGLEGIFKIEDVPTDSINSSGFITGNTLMISGIFAVIPSVISFDILDSNYSIIGSFTGAKMLFNEKINNFSPLWKKDLSFFEDFSISPFDFSSISNTISYLRINTSTITGTEKKYPFIKLAGNGLSSFYIEGFENNQDTGSITSFNWTVYNSSNISLASGTSGRIRPDYFSDVITEQFINNNATVLNRYYIDHKFKDHIDGGEGSYMVFWSVINNGIPEIYSKTYLVYNDFLNKDVTTKKFKRNNFSDLLESYMPFFYKDYGTDDVLKQTVNSFGESIYDLLLKADQFPGLIDPFKAETRFLPYLGNMFSYGLKGSRPIEWRQQIKRLPLILKKKGTLSGLTEILSLAGIEVLTATFYWQIKSKYLWTDYYFLKNNGEKEQFELKFNPLVQITGVNQEFDFSRYLVEYYSQEKLQWYNLTWNRTNNLGVIIDSQTVIDLFQLNPDEEVGQTIKYSKKINWDFQNVIQDQYFLKSEDILKTTDIGNQDFGNNSTLINNDISGFHIQIISGKVNLGKFELISITSDISDPAGDELRINYRETKKFNLTSPLPITFRILRNGEFFDSNNYTALLTLRKNTIQSIKDSSGKIKVKLNTASDTDSPELITPKFNDVIKIRYQFEKYPYEVNSSSPDFKIGFDETEICRDDFILALDSADTRSVFDSGFQNSRLIPFVNFNIKLLPDSVCFSKKENDLECLDSYDICDLCFERNSLQEPVVFGKIRTKFPWSENVYNMDEYDGSTRPSNHPCDIDESFIDGCACCWSSFFSLSVSISNISDKLIIDTNTIIEEFKPLHSTLKTLSFVAAHIDNLHIEDCENKIQALENIDDNLEIGYFLPNGREIISGSSTRSNTYFFASDTFSVLSSDMDVYLLDNNVTFEEIPIGIKLSSIGPLPENINISRVEIENPTGIHANRTYNISEIGNKKIKLISGVDDNGDVLPSTPYVSDGPWIYSIYNRKYPDTAQLITSSPPWPEPVNMTISKTGKYVIQTSVNILSAGIEIINTPYSDNIYKVVIESGGGIPGIYNILKLDDNDIILSDYPFSIASVGTVSFTLTKNGLPIVNLTSILGTLVKQDVFGEFTIGSGDDLVSDWDINLNKAYVQVGSPNGIYYKIVEITNDFVKFSGYGNGPIGNKSIAIFEKIVSSTTGTIVASTDIIRYNNIDIYDIINSTGDERPTDFEIGIDIGNTGTFTFYEIESVFSMEKKKIRLKSFSIGTNILSDPISTRVHLLTDNSINTVIPPFGFDKLLTGTSTGGSSTSLIDTTKNFDNEIIKAGDIVYNVTDDTWSLISIVSGFIINFSSALSQAGVAFGVFGTDEYQIIRRKLFDTGQSTKPLSDIVKININPALNNNGDAIWVPVQNITELSSGQYDIKIQSENGDSRQTVDIERLKQFVTFNVLIGPLENIDPKYRPGNISNFRIISQSSVVNDKTGITQNEQLNIPISDVLNIDSSSISLTVNNIAWNQVTTWTDIIKNPGLSSQREFIVKKNNNKNIQIWFGDNIHGKSPTTGDIIIISYPHYGIIKGPVSPEKISVRTKDIIPDDPIFHSSTTTTPSDDLTEKEHAFFVITTVATGVKTKVYVAN